MKPLDPRLLRYSAAARGYLAVTVALGLAATGLILFQASLLAHVLAAAATGTGVAVLGGTLGLLAAVLAARAAASYGGEVTALRAAAAVKSQLRRRLIDHTLELGPSWLTRHRSGEVTTLATRGLDGLDAYFARYLPQLVLACVVPFAVLIRVAFADWISGVVIGVTLPLIPVFAVLVGLHTKATTQRQWRLLARLGGHFLDVVEGLPTLKLFGRGKPQAEVIGRVTDEYRKATMSSLRVAFLSGFVLELAAALATALVAVEVGLRLLAGHMSYQTALLVLLLTPEAYLPLRAVGAQFHASTEGAAAARDVFEIIDTPVPAAARELARTAPAVTVRSPSVRDKIIRLNEVTLSYPERARPALDCVSVTIRPGDHLTLTGPSGAGKSSLLALLLRFAEPTGGRIEVGGTDLEVHPGAGVAPPDRLGPAAPAPVRRHRGREHRAWRPGGKPRGHRGGGQRRGRRGVHRGPAAGLRHAGRGARPSAVLGPAAADRAGPRVPARRAAAPARRAHRAPGPGQRRPRGGGAGHEDGRTDGDPRRPRPQLDPRKGAHPGSGQAAPGHGAIPRACPCAHPCGGDVMTAIAPPAAVPAARGHSLVRLLRLAFSSRPMRRELLLAVLAGAAGCGCGVALLAVSGFLLARASQHPNIVAISVAVVMVRALSVGRGLLRYLERLFSHDVAFRVLADVRVTIYRKLERLAPAGLAAFRSGDMLTRLISDVDATQDLFIRGIAPPLTAALVGAGATTAVLLILAPAAGVLAAGLLAAGVLVPLTAAASARQAARRAAPARGELGGAVTDLLNGAAELHAFGAVQAGLDRARTADAELTRHARRTAAASGLGTGLTAIVSGLTLWGVLLLGVAATGSGSLGRVPLAVITLTALAAFEAVTALPAAALQLGQARAAADRIADVLDAPDPVTAPDRPFPPPGRPVHVCIRGGSVRYLGQATTVVREIDLDLRPGRRSRPRRPGRRGEVHDRRGTVPLP